MIESHPVAFKLADAPIILMKGLSRAVLHLRACKNRSTSTELMTQHRSVLFHGCLPRDLTKDPLFDPVMASLHSHTLYECNRHP